MIIFIMWNWPLDKQQYLNRIDTFNEVLTLQIMYLMMLLSPFVPSIEMK